MNKQATSFVQQSNLARVDQWDDIPVWCAGLVIVAGLMALTGWCFDITALKGLLSDGVAMSVNTAHLLILSGISLLLLHSGYIRAARMLLTIILLFALAIVYENISDTNFYIDQSPIPHYLGNTKTVGTGRTPLLMALYTVLGSTAMLLSSYRRYYTAQFISSTLIILIYISILGTLFHFLGSLVSTGVVGTAFHTTASLLVLALGTMLLKPGEGWIKLMYSRLARKDLLVYLAGYILAGFPLFAALYLFVIKNSTIAPASDMLVLFLLTIILSVPVVYFLSRLFNRLEDEVRGAHEQLRIAVHASGSGVWDLDLEQGILSHSAQFTQLFGNPNKIIVTPQGLWRCFYAEDAEQAKAAFEQAVRTGKLDFQARILTENSRIKWLQFYGETQLDRSGIPVRLLGTVMDITARKELEQQKDEFISVASHELKTPLTSLKSYVQLAHNMSKAQDARAISGMIEKAETQINKMTRLIRDFLNAAQSESGKMVLYRQEFFLDDLVREIIADLSVNLKKRQIQLNDCPPIKVNADREKIEQVLGNLIGNALKYSVGDKPVVLNCSKEDGHVRVRVDDHGIGISDEDKLYLFERFFRSENPNSKDISGFGIGLYVSAEIVRLHGGNIGVDSEIGKGSSFWFELPVGVSVGDGVKVLVK